MTLTANKDYVLHNGQVYLLKFNNKVIDGWYFDDAGQLRESVIDDEDYWCVRKDYGMVVASTDKSLPVKHIDRSLFVKPLDVEGMQDAYIHEQNYYHYSDRDIDVIKSAYEDGYNSNPNQFTLDDFIGAIHLAYSHGRLKELSVEESVNTCLNMYKPIEELPPTIDCNENYDNIKCNW